LEGDGERPQAQKAGLSYRDARVDLAEMGRSVLRPYGRTLLGAEGAQGVDLGGAAGREVAGS
jgi:hypothetical protein